MFRFENHGVSEHAYPVRRGYANTLAVSGLRSP